MNPFIHRTDAATLEKLCQVIRAPVRLAAADEIKTGRPRRFSSRRERVENAEIIGKVHRIFGL